jgi:hypothetical protein
MVIVKEIRKINKNTKKSNSPIFGMYFEFGVSKYQYMSGKGKGKGKMRQASR